VTVHGKVFVLDFLSFVTCFFSFPPFSSTGCQGIPVKDGTEVAAYDDAAIPATASYTARLQQALAHLERLPKKNPKTVERLRKLLARAQKARPTKVPGGANPVATARTSNGNYTMQVPASFIGRDLLVCVTGQPATPTPNPGNPNIVGFCTTLTVQENRGGSTMVNQVNFIAPELTGDNNFLLDVRSAVDGRSVIGKVIGQREALDFVFTRPVTPGLKAQLDRPTGTATTPDACFWFEADAPFDVVYSGYGGTSTGFPRFVPTGSAMRVVTSLPKPDVYRFQGAVQWRSERTQDTPYSLFEECPADIFRMEPGRILVVTPSTDVGQFVTPVIEELEVLPFFVRQDTELPRFATGGLGLPPTPAPGWGNYSLDGDVVHIPFSEPIVDASPPPSVSFLLSLETGTAPCPCESVWTMFVPAGDLSNFSKPRGTPFPPPAGMPTDFLFDAHRNTFVPTGGVFHRDDSGVADAVVAARLHRLRLPTDVDGDDVPDRDPNADGPEDKDNSVLTRYSAGFGDAWRAGPDPTFIADKAGNQVTAGGGDDAFLTFGGKVVD